MHLKRVRLYSQKASSQHDVIKKRARERVIPILKTLIFFISFMVLIQFLSDFLSKISGSYGDVLLLAYFLGFPSTYTYLFMRIWNGVTFEEIGFRNPEKALNRFLFGIFLGFCIISSFFAFFYCFGYVKLLGFVKPPKISIILQEILISLILVYNEELIFRGYMLNTARKSGLWYSLLITSLTFGIAHLSNPNINILAILGLTVAGFLLAASFLIYDEIWVPIGLHFMWNLAEEKIFGFPLSGLDPKSWLFSVKLTGPEWITGGNFGPEGGLIPILIELLAILVIIKFWLRRSSPQPV